jgi:hypothetical protein
MYFYDIPLFVFGWRLVVDGAIEGPVAFRVVGEGDAGSEEGGWIACEMEMEMEH